MEYKSKSDLPETLWEVLPDEAQETYLEAYQEAWDDYPEDEGVAMSRTAMARQLAWTTVKEEYVQDEGSGTWYPRGKVPGDDDGDRGLVHRLKDALGL